MKRALSLLIAAVMSLTALAACGSDDSSSQSDKKTSSSAESGASLGKKAVGAALGIGALVLIPSMVGYVNKSQQAAANANAKMLYTALRTVLADLEAEGKPAKSNCAGRQVKLSELKDSTELDKQVYAYLGSDLDGDALIYFELDGHDVSYVTYQKNESSPVGAYPLSR